ncbi:MAG: O-antigen ligase family protein [Acidobacteriales bacterium]|nr:O-antigen ligase family protein [Terriglobales bacterium]
MNVTRQLDRLAGPAALILACLFGSYIVLRAPGYATSTQYLSGLIFLEVLLAATWNFRQRFLPLLTLAFFWAGMNVPLSSTWSAGRWLVLGTGAVAGFILYMKDRRHYFGGFHLAALFCVLAALVSTRVSAYPALASLKSLSLLGMFLYAASGARLALIGREEKFVSGLLKVCEFIVYPTAIFYFFFHLALFGNPNSLGAVFGVTVVPVMLWGILVSEGTLRRRRTFAFTVALVILLSSYARAGIAAASVSCVLMCVGLRRYRLLVKGAGLALLAAALVAAKIPLEAELTGQPVTMTSAFIYKGHTGDILGSRRSVWDQTSDVIRDHPWFGSGFGTSNTTAEVTRHDWSAASLPESMREHGNSYLEITEWVGLLGVTPFFALVFLVFLNTRKVFLWVRKTNDSHFYGIPFAAVLIAGIVHAGFEDWLFAVGYYLCVIFWVFAFMLVDVLAPASARLPETEAPAWPAPAGMVSSIR